MFNSIIIIPHFTHESQRTQGGAQKGFLLLELVITLALGLILFGVGIAWQGLILFSMHQSARRIEMLQKTNNLMHGFEHNFSTIKRAEHKEDSVYFTWKIERVQVEGLVEQLPFVRQPKNFKLIPVKIAYQENGNTRKIELVAGVINAE